MTITKLPPFNSITGRYMTKKDHFKAYIVWRKSPSYIYWRSKQWKIQKGKCYYCKISLVGRVSNVEHVVAQRYWGETSTKNMVLSCAPCNKEKGIKKASKELRNNVSRNNFVKRRKKKSEKKKWQPFR